MQMAARAEWVEWVIAPTEIQLENGRIVDVAPGDQLLIEELAGDKGFLVFDHKPRVLH